MPSQVDFAVAVGLFITFIVILFAYLTGYMTSYVGMLSASELRSIAYNIHKSLFGSEGVPENWQDYDITPVKVGLLTNLYRIPIVVRETSGIDRELVTMNISLSFDSACENKTWNTTVRMYNETDEVPTQLYNQSFCISSYLNSSDVVFTSVFMANENKTLFVYFSPDKVISAPNYSISFASAASFSIERYPTDELYTVSVEKMNALRNKSYDEIVRTFGRGYDFNVELDAT
jgi:hypothetical protein